MDAGLPLHAHAPGSGLEHNVRCDSGRIVVFIHPDERHVLETGQTLSFDTTRWHGIAPLTVGACFTNTAQTSQPEFHSVLESRHYYTHTV